jgi:hypothetical protein
MMKKWIEKNIQLKGTGYDTWDKIILDFTFDFVQKVKSDIDTWHYLGETPYFCLRFYGEESTIDQIRHELDSDLDLWAKKNPNVFSRHFYGCHQEEGKEYSDAVELPRFRAAGWPIMTHYLHYGSETAMNYRNHISPIGKGYEIDTKRMQDLFEHLLPNYNYPEYIQIKDKQSGYWPIIDEWLTRKSAIENECKALANLGDPVEERLIRLELEKGFDHLFLGCQLLMHGH